MRKHYLPIAASLVVIVVLLALAARVVTAPQEVAPPTFPVALNERLVLPDQELGELHREVTYADDGTTILRADVYFVDGSVGYAKYQPNGYVGEFGTYYPESPGSSRAQLKMEAEWGPDGTHMLWEKHYTEAGVLIKEGKRLDDGNYLVNAFQDDGVSIAGTYVYNEDGESYSTAEFYDNGVTKKLVRSVDDYTKETTDFAESGKKTHYHWQRNEHIIWEKYQADGKTPIYRFEQKPHGTQGGVNYQTYATYYNPDGTVNHERKFGRYSMYVNFLDADGEIILQQIWNNKKANKPDISMESDQWFLYGVLIGGDIYKAGTSFWFDESGYTERHVYTVDIGNGVTKNVIKVYYPDGSLASWSRPDPSNPAKTLKTEYEQGESDQVFDMGVLNGSHLPVDYIVPPQVPPESKTYHR